MKRVYLNRNWVIPPLALPRGHNEAYYKLYHKGMSHHMRIYVALFEPDLGFLQGEIEDGLEYLGRVMDL